MKRLLQFLILAAPLAVWFWWSDPLEHITVWAQQTYTSRAKQANLDSLPDNTTGAISPENIRDAVGSLYDTVDDSMAAVEAALAESTLTLTNQMAAKIDAVVLPDSIANKHPLIKADTVRTNVLESTAPIVWDLYASLVPDSTIAAANSDSIDFYERYRVLAADKDTAYRADLVSKGAGGSDSLGLCQDGYAITENPDSLGIQVAVSNNSTVRVDVLVMTADGDTVFYSYNVATSSTTAMGEVKVAAFSGTAKFDVNERYVVYIKVILPAGAWARIGRTRVW